MENQELHAQKVTILSRLIKESSLTLEEALLILKEEEPVQAPINLVRGSGTAVYPPMGTWSTSTVPAFISTTGGTTTFTNTIADSSADLNN